MQAWIALVGVVLGALIGIAGQLLAAHLSRRREEAARTFEFRRQVYLDFLACTHRLIAATGPQSADSNERRAELLTALMTSTQAVFIVAPEHTQDAAYAVTDALTARMDGTESAGTLDAALVEFAALARKDLGLVDATLDEVKESLADYPH